MFTKAILTVVLLSISNLAQSALVYIDPASQNIDPGAEVSISILGADFDASKPIEGGGINLAFDASILQVKDVTVDGQIWEFLTTTGDVDNLNGTLNGLTFSSFAGRSGSFSIAQVVFQTVGTGTSLLTLSESNLNPFSSGGELLDPAVSFSSSEITVVPIPTAFWLFVSGLMGFTSVVRKPV